MGGDSQRQHGLHVPNGSQTRYGFHLFVGTHHFTMLK